jgi:hypothetical protein
VQDPSAVGRTKSFDDFVAQQLLEDTFHDVDIAASSIHFMAKEAKQHAPEREDTSRRSVAATSHSVGRTVPTQQPTEVDPFLSQQRWLQRQMRHVANTEKGHSNGCQSWELLPPAVQPPPRRQATTSRRRSTGEFVEWERTPTSVAPPEKQQAALPARTSRGTPASDAQRDSTDSAASSSNSSLGAEPVAAPAVVPPVSTTSRYRLESDGSRGAQESRVAALRRARECRARRLGLVDVQDGEHHGAVLGGASLIPADLARQPAMARAAVTPPQLLHPCSADSSMVQAAKTRDRCRRSPHAAGATSSQGRRISPHATQPHRWAADVSTTCNSKSAARERIEGAPVAGSVSRDAGQCSAPRMRVQVTPRGRSESAWPDIPDLSRKLDHAAASAIDAWPDLSL